MKIIEVGELLWVPDDAVKVSEAFRGMRSFTALLWSRRSGYEID